MSNAPLDKQIAELMLIGKERAHLAERKRSRGQTQEADNIELRLNTLRDAVRTLKTIEKGE